MRGTARILSIQSSVVHGYVGNKAAMFPLQVLGFDVDPINSVQLSNHTGYAKWTGQRLQGEHLDELVRGLESNQLLAYDYLMTGYIGTESFLQSVLSLMRNLKATNPALQFVCDPVLGDQGKLYVAEGYVAVYRDKIIPHADVLLPNQTEAEFLTGVKIRTLGDAARACQALHDLGPKVVVITSIELASAPGTIEVFLSVVNVGQWKYSVARIPQTYSGTGDLFSALCLAHLRTHPAPDAISLTLATVRQVLERTRAAGRKEILLIESRDDIIDPTRLEPVAPVRYDAPTSEQSNVSMS
ncbi:pyridoxal kinase [Plasmodiophora brassicae]